MHKLGAGAVTCPTISIDFAAHHSTTDRCIVMCGRGLAFH